MLKSVTLRFIPGMLLLSVGTGVHADTGSLSKQAQAVLNDMYVTFNVGRANSRTSVDEVQADFDNAGISNTTIEEVNDQRFGFGLGVGYKIDSNWAVELGYLDLEQVDVKFTSSQAINNLEDVHPESGDGFALSGLYQHPLDEKTHVRLRMGLFNWDASYRTTIASGSRTGKDSDSGTNLYWGLGFSRQLTPQLSLQGEFQTFEFDRANSHFMTLGVSWRLFK